MRIIIIVPTYNEDGIISSLLDTLLFEISMISQHSFSILIVDGKSTDDTVKIVKDKMVKNKNIQVITEVEKGGLGAAYLYGINYAINNLRADAFMEFDGDFQHDPKDIVKLVRKLDEGYDYIIGSRYIKDGSIPKEWAFYRRKLSKFGNIIIKTLLNINIRDATSGFRLTRTIPLKDILPLKKGDLLSLRHAYKIHFLFEAIKGGVKAVEVPITFLNRNKGISKSTFEDVLESLRVIWGLVCGK